MVKRFISFFFREYKNVHMAAFLLAVSTFASQILALRKHGDQLDQDAGQAALLHQATERERRQHAAQ